MGAADRCHFSDKTKRPGQGAAATSETDVRGWEVEKGSFREGQNIRVCPFWSLIFRLFAAWQVDETLQPLPSGHVGDHESAHSLDF